jgi:hypothetical protein
MSATTADGTRPSSGFVTSVPSGGSSAHVGKAVAVAPEASSSRGAWYSSREDGVGSPAMPSREDLFFRPPSARSVGAAGPPSTPSLSTRKAGLLSAVGETTLFADDALVITPGPSTTVEDLIMQYRVSGYSGVTAPPSDWQDSRLEMWRGVAQWCFTLPRGRMAVEVRAVSRASGAASAPSAAKAFLVRGKVLEHLS